MSEEDNGKSGQAAAHAEASGRATLHNVVSIVAAYVGNNSLRAADLPDFIASVHASINQLSKHAPPVVEPAAEAPAVPVKRSVTKDHIVCLEDGKKFKSLRRHLASFHNLTPDAYRAKWGLAKDYPMVAPAYSATRSQLAKDSGLGQVSRPGDGDADAATQTNDGAPKPGRRSKRAT